MKATSPFLRRAWLSLLLGAALSGYAQSRFQITTYTDRGGAVSSGGSFSVLGTAGQSDAAATSVGQFAFSGGFWSTIEGALPRLAIRSEGNQVILSWPNPSTGFQLQERSPIAASGWANVGAPTSVVGANKEVSLNIGPDSRGFRLNRP